MIKTPLLKITMIKLNKVKPGMKKSKNLFYNSLEKNRMDYDK